MRTIPEGPAYSILGDRKAIAGSPSSSSKEFSTRRTDRHSSATNLSTLAVDHLQGQTRTSPRSMGAFNNHQALSGEPKDMWLSGKDKITTISTSASQGNSCGEGSSNTVNSQMGIPTPECLSPTESRSPPNDAAQAGPLSQLQREDDCHAEFHPVTPATESPEPVRQVKASNESSLESNRDISLSELLWALHEISMKFEHAPRAHEVISAFRTQYGDVRYYLRNERVFLVDLKTSDAIVNILLTRLYCHLKRVNAEFLSQRDFIRSEGMPWAGKFQANLCVHPADLEMDMNLLRIFSRGDHCTKILGKRSYLLVLYGLMVHLPLERRFQAECSATLANLAGAEANRTLMLETPSPETSLVSLVLNNLQRFMGDTTIALELCAVIKNLACFERSSKYLIRAGGLQLITNSLKMHYNSPDVLVQALSALTSMCRHAANPMIEALNAGSIIFEISSKHAENLDVMLASCNSIGFLAFDYLNIGQHRRDIVITLLKSMVFFRDAVQYQIAACFALAHLFFNRSKGIMGLDGANHHANLDVEMYTECLDLIFSSMQRFPDHEALNVTACFAIGTVVRIHEDARAHCVQAHGLELVIDAMSKFIAPSQEENKEDADSYRVPPGRMDTFEINVGIQTSDGHTHEFGEDSDGKSEQGSKFPNHCLLQMFGSIALLHVFECDKYKDRVIFCGGIQAIARAMHIVRGIHLSFVLSYIFSQVTGSSQVIFVKPKAIPRLEQLAMAALEGLFSDEGPKQYASILPSFMITHLEQASSCGSCGRACLEMSIAKYSVKVAQIPRIQRFCSEWCASQDSEWAKAGSKCQLVHPDIAKECFLSEKTWPSLNPEPIVPNQHNTRSSNPSIPVLP